MKTIILGLALLIAPVTSANAYLNVSPGSMEFGGVKIGTQSSQYFYINNYGNDDANIYGCNIFGAFQCQLFCYGILRHGQSCTGMIYFYPRTEGYEFDSVMIQSDKGLLTISVHGSGVL